jgi:hypothetical protein
VQYLCWYLADSTTGTIREVPTEILHRVVPAAVALMRIEILRIPRLVRGLAMEVWEDPIEEHPLGEGSTQRGI